MPTATPDFFPAEQETPDFFPAVPPPIGLTKSPSLAPPPSPSPGLSLGQAPSKVPDRASQIVSEQEEQRAAQFPVSPVSPGAGATPAQTARLLPKPSTLGGGAQPNVSVGEDEKQPAIAPITGGPFPTYAAVPPPFIPATDTSTNAERRAAAVNASIEAANPEEAGPKEVAQGFGELVPRSSVSPNPTLKQAEVGATHVLKGATTAATPMMVSGAVLAPEAAILAGAGAAAGGYGAKKVAQLVHASPEAQDLAEQAGQIAGGFAGGGAFEGLKHLSNPENALTDLLWKRGYIQDNNGHPIYITSQEQARAVAQEIIKQNPQGIVGSAVTKARASTAAENVPARQNMGVAEPAGDPKMLPEFFPEHPVHHASNDVEDLRASAEKQAPAIGDAVGDATKNVEGAKLEAVRDSKDSDRIADKAERQGIQPSQVGDIAAAKVTVPDQAAADQVLANLDKTMPVESAEGKVSGEAGKNGVRQVQAIVDTKAPAGEPVKKAEVIIQTPEMAKATDATHDDYRRAQELRAAGKNDEAAKLEQELTQKHEAAERAAQERQNVSTQGTEAPAKKKSNSEPLSAPAPKGKALPLLAPKPPEKKKKAVPTSAPAPLETFQA